MVENPSTTTTTPRIDEDQRLRQGLGRLELARVQEIVRRHLPPGSRVLDVGGATGVHAEWLLADGHTVHLVDLLAGHVARATESLGDHPRFTATVGDARTLPLPDASVDVVLLLGPLYHLTERADRLAVWREASRVVVPGGVVVAMGISRFASLFDGLAQAYLFDPAFRAIVAQDLATGVHENPTGDPRWFTTAYFHRPEELAAEASEVGLDVRETVGVEGMAHWMQSLAPVFDDGADPADREVVLDAARAVEAEPSLLGLSPHLVTVAVRPPDVGSVSVLVCAPVSDDFHDPDLISTGHLPREELVVQLMQDAHDRYAGVDDGAVADYIPALADADPALFGLSIVSVTGASHSVGDALHEFSIQSVSKAFVFALVCDALGPGGRARRGRREQHRPAVQLGHGARAERAAAR